MFRDITTLLGDARAFRRAVDELVQPFAGMKIDKVAGIEARGFILGGAVAHQLSAGFVPLRKKGKLPHQTRAVEYALEYGSDVMEMHLDAVLGRRAVMLVDDLIATGGTALAAVELLSQAGARSSPPPSWSTCPSSAAPPSCAPRACAVSTLVASRAIRTSNRPQATRANGTLSLAARPGATLGGWES